MPDTLVCLIMIDKASGLPDLPDQEWEVVPDLRKQDLLFCFGKSILLRKIRKSGTIHKFVDILD